MIDFQQHKITLARSLGSKLKEARLESGRSLERAAKDLNINIKYLAALESDELVHIPGEVYLQNFLKKYCLYLRLNYDEYWQLAKKILPPGRRWQQKVERRDFFSWPRFWERLVVVGLILVVAAFLVISVERIFLPPQLAITSPTNDSLTTSTNIEVIGRCEKEAQLMINNRAIFVNDRGEFSATVDLQKGVNFIKITAQKRYGQPREITLRVLATDQQD